MEIKPIDVTLLTRSRLEVIITRVISPLFFWVRFKLSEPQLKELEEELTFRMARKSSYLHYWPDALKEEEIVSLKVNNFWRRGWIIKINREQMMVKVCVGDYGLTFWRPMRDIYILEDQFRALPWQSIACGLAYTAARDGRTVWDTKTIKLCQLLAGGHTGWINIIHPLQMGTALVKLTVKGTDFEGEYDLRETLIRLKHAEATTQITVDVFPAI